MTSTPAPPAFNQMTTPALRETFESLPDGLDRFRALCEIHLRHRPFPSQESLDMARELHRIARAMGDNGARAYSLEMIGNVQHEFGRHAVALRYLRRSVRLQEEMPERRPMYARALHGLGRAYEALGRHAEAMEQYQRALDAARGFGDVERIAAALTGIGEVFRMLGDYDRALAATLESLPHWDALGNHQGLGVAHNNIGILHGLMKHHERALAEFQASLEQYRAIEDMHGQAIALGNIGCAYAELGTPQLGYAPLEQSLEIHRRAGQRRYEAGTLGLLATACLLENRLEAAREHLEAARAIFEATGFPAGVCEVANDLGDLLQRQGRMDESIPVLEHARALGAELGYRLQIAKSDRLLAAAWEARGDAERALASYRRFMAGQQEIQNEEVRRAMQAMQYRMDVERAERDREIFRLRAERLEQESHLRAQELAAMAMRLGQKNELLTSMKDLVHRLSSGSAGHDSALARDLIARIEDARDTDAEWDAYEQRLQTVHPGFMRVLRERCPDLTPAELKVCALLRANVASKEIAALLSTTVRTVEKHRQHIRRKLKLSGTENLILYLAAI